MSYADPRQIEDTIAASANAGLSSPESELALVGAAMRAPDLCEELFDTALPTQFGDPLLGRIWGAAAHLFHSGRAIGPAFVRDALGVDKGFDEWGGVDRLTTLCDFALLEGLPQHAEAVVDRSVRRGVRRLLDQTAEVLPKTDTEAVEVLATLERGAAEIAHQGVTGERWLAAADMIETAISNARRRRGELQFPSGLRAVDDLLGGVHPGEVTLVAARSGMGKTTAAQRYANATASAGKGVVYISLEMDADPMALRLACDVAYDRHAVAYSGVTTNPTVDLALKGALSDDQWERLRAAGDHVRSWPFLFEVRPGLTIAQIEAASRRQFRKWERQNVPPGLVIIDHIGKVRPSKDRKGSRHQEVADISGDVASMAKRLGVPILALVQLNRQVEGRDDKRPILSDLRAAGELEEDARQVVFIYRPEYYLREGKDGETFDEKVDREAKLAQVTNKLWWIVEKNSHGPRGQALSFCNMGCSAVRDWD